MSRRPTYRGGFARSSRATTRYSCPHSRQKANGNRALSGWPGTTAWYRPVICRTCSGSRLMWMPSPLERNWCNRKANRGRPVCGSTAAEPARRVVRMASPAAASSMRVTAANRTAARETVVGRRRISRSVPGSRSRPNAVSIQAASGSARSPAKSAGGGCRSRAASPVTASSVSSAVARCNVSPITRSGRTSAPNSLVAISDTARCCSARLPPLAMVADVPTHCSAGAEHTFRNRRTRRATSAPWRPR